MPSDEPRERRVPEAFARQTAIYLRQAGLLDVMEAIDLDEYDLEERRLKHLLAHGKLTDPDVIAEIQKAQGALEQIRKHTRLWRRLAEPESAGPVRADDLTVRPATVRVRKRAGGAL